MNPEDQGRLDHCRAGIDRIDDQILKLLAERAEFVLEIGDIKTRNKMELWVPSRERAIFERLLSKEHGQFPDEAVRKVFREIISASLALEHPQKVVYLGPRASFTHIASLQQFGHSAALNPCKTIPSVFEEVRRGRAQYGVVPIENSTEGAVTHTLDMFPDSELTIISEIYLEIRHDLLNRSGKLSDVNVIYSHPQALGQCRNWLGEHCSEIPLLETSSTAQAAQFAADDETVAAIAGGVAANLYGLQVIVPKIEDHHNNYTRFLVIGTKMPDRGGHDKTSVLFAFEDGAGVLSRMLEPFKKRDLNLMKIESRPQKTTAWQYHFFLDIEGHLEDAPVAEAIEELRGMCTTLKVLGSYPRGR